MFEIFFLEIWALIILPYFSTHTQEKNGDFLFFYQLPVSVVAHLKDVSAAPVRNTAANHQPHDAVANTSIVMEVHVAIAIVTC